MVNDANLTDDPTRLQLDRLRVGIKHQVARPHEREMGNGLRISPSFCARPSDNFLSGNVIHGSFDKINVVLPCFGFCHTSYNWGIFFMGFVPSLGYVVSIASFPDLHPRERASHEKRVSG